MQRWIVAFLLFFTLIGCKRAGDPGENLQGKKKIGVSVLTLNNPFFKVIADTLRAELGSQGYEVISLSGENLVETQKKQVQNFIVERVSAIVLCPCDSRSIASAIQEANRAGIPVFTADIACLDPQVDVKCHIATDNLDGGRQAAHAMIEALGDKGGKILLLDMKEVESCILRVKGFKEVLNDHNQKNPGKAVAIVAELSGEGKKDKGKKATEDALQSHRDLDGIFAINDPSALGALAALESAGRADRVKVVGFDGQPEGKKAIKDGKIYADPVQYPDRIGKQTAQAILRYFRGEKVDRQILIPTGLYRQADGIKDAGVQ